LLEKTETFFLPFEGNFEFFVVLKISKFLCIYFRINHGTLDDFLRDPTVSGNPG
jgi:hypothetical protein